MAALGVLMDDPCQQCLLLLWHFLHGDLDWIGHVSSDLHQVAEISGEVLVGRGRKGFITKFGGE